MKMRNAKRLKYGQTPWDKLTREELLLTVCRYHQALISAASCLRVARTRNEDSPYWSLRGSGGKALAMADFMDHSSGNDTDEGRENIYRQFFRPSAGVIFGGMEGAGLCVWWICEGCGQMVGAEGKETPKRYCHCKTPWRPFTLSDIRPDLAVVNSAT